MHLMSDLFSLQDQLFMSWNVIINYAKCDLDSMKHIEVRCAIYLRLLIQDFLHNTIQYYNPPASSTLKPFQLFSQKALEYACIKNFGAACLNFCEMH